MMRTEGDAQPLHSSSTNANARYVSDDPSILSVREIIQDIAFGSFAGMVSEVFEYPFDLAKVRLQAQVLAPSSNKHTRFAGPMDCLTQTWRDEGFRGLYRGLPAPIVGSMAETASLFLSYSAFQNLIRQHWPNTLMDRSQPLSITQLGVAASGAGFVTSFILTPIELVKCKMQVQMMNIPPSKINARHITAGAIPPVFSPALPNGSAPVSLRPSPILNFISNAQLAVHDFIHLPMSAPRPPGPFSIVRSTVEAHGVRGLWLGHTGTMLRETGGCAAWFVCKEWIAGCLIERRMRQYPSLSFRSDAAGMSRPSPIDMNPLPWESAVSGAIAGAAGALVLYPADTVKSAMQTEEELRSHSPSSTKLSKLPVRTFGGTFARMYVMHGFRGLYAGCGMTVLRAVPSSGIIFVVYDGLTAWFA